MEGPVLWWENPVTELKRWVRRLRSRTGRRWPPAKWNRRRISTARCVAAAAAQAEGASRRLPHQPFLLLLLLLPMRSPLPRIVGRSARDGNRFSFVFFDLPTPSPPPCLAFFVSKSSCDRVRAPRVESTSGHFPLFFFFLFLFFF